MLRRLATSLSVASLVLCLLSALMWMRSYTHGFTMSDVSAYTASGDSAPIEWQPKVPRVAVSDWKFESMPGEFFWERRTARARTTGRFSPSPEDGIGFVLGSWPWREHEVKESWGTEAFEMRRVRDAGGWTGAGFGYSSGSDPALDDPEVASSLQRAVAPWWAPVAVFGLLPAARGATWLRRRVRRRLRQARNQCLSCGYDLRGSPERCPECGRTPADDGRPTA